MCFHAMEFYKVYFKNTLQFLATCKVIDVRIHTHTHTHTQHTHTCL